MRWLIVHPGPEFSVHDVYVGWAEALRFQGETVLEYNLNDRLTFYDACAIETGRRDEQGRPEFRKALQHDQAVELAVNGLLSALYQCWPDVLLIVSGFFTRPQLLEIVRARKHKIVILHTESPYEDQRQLEISQFADVTLLNDPCTIDQYRQVCPVVAYAPHAYRPSIHYPGTGIPAEFDLVFSGTGYESRIEFFTQMRLRGLKVGLAGNWIQLKRRSSLVKYLLHDPSECLDNEQTAELYRWSKAGINFYRREGDDDAAPGWAMGPREIEQAACGLFFLRDPRPESDELLPMLPSFTSAADAGEQLRWWLRHDSQREQAAAAACQAVAHRTFSSNAEMLLRLLDRQPVTI